MIRIVPGHRELNLFCLLLWRNWFNDDDFTPKSALRDWLNGPGAATFTALYMNWQLYLERLGLPASGRQAVLTTIVGLLQSSGTLPGPLRELLTFLRDPGDVAEAWWQGVRGTLHDDLSALRAIDLNSLLQSSAWPHDFRWPDWEQLMVMHGVVPLGYSASLCLPGYAIRSCPLLLLVPVGVPFQDILSIALHEATHIALDRPMRRLVSAKGTEQQMTRLLEEAYTTFFEELLVSQIVDIAPDRVYSPHLSGLGTLVEHLRLTWHVQWERDCGPLSVDDFVSHTYSTLARMVQDECV